jgi:tetratricopeptide (TPR) repeat protein
VHEYVLIGATGAGNTLFQRGQYDQALAKYSNAVLPNALSYANAVLIHLNRRSWNKAQTEAAVDCKLQPTYGKAWFRLVKACLGWRDFPRALMFCKDALKALPSEDPAAERLKASKEMLEECEVPAKISSNMDHPQQQDAKKRMLAGAPSDACMYCGNALPKPLSDFKDGCLWCACDLTNHLGKNLTEEALFAL